MLRVLRGAEDLPAVSLTDGPQAWRRLGLAFVAAVIANAGNWTAVTLMPVMQEAWELSRSAASWPYIAVMTGFLLASPVSGRWSDRSGVAPVLAVSALLSAAGYLLGAVSGSFALYMVGQFLVGAGTAAGFAPLTADLSHWFVRRRAFVLGLAGSAAYVSGLLWSALIPWLLTLTGWRGIHLILALSMLLILPLAQGLRPRISAEVWQAADLTAAENIARTGLSAPLLGRLLALAGFCCCVAMAMPQVHIVAYCMDLGYSLAQGGSLLTIMMLAGIASRLILSLIMDQIGALQVLLVAVLLQAVSLAVFALADGMPTLYAVSLLFGLSQGGILPSYPLIVRQFLPARSAGAVTGTVVMATVGGMSAGSWLSGALFDLSGTYGGALTAGVLSGAVTAAVCAFLLRRHQRGRS